MILAFNFLQRETHDEDSGLNGVKENGFEAVYFNASYLGVLSPFFKRCTGSKLALVQGNPTLGWYCRVQLKQLQLEKN